MTFTVALPILIILGNASEDSFVYPKQKYEGLLVERVDQIEVYDLAYNYCLYKSVLPGSTFSRLELLWIKDYTSSKIRMANNPFPTAPPARIADAMKTVSAISSLVAPAFLAF